MEAPIQRWENERFAREVSTELALIETTEPVRRLQAATSVVPPADTIALCGRINAGLAVQLLTTTGKDVRAWITLDVNGQTETIEVEPKDALDAYHHPYAYGATLPL